MLIAGGHYIDFPLPCTNELHHSRDNTVTADWSSSTLARQVNGRTLHESCLVRAHQIIFHQRLMEGFCVVRSFRSLNTITVERGTRLHHLEQEFPQVDKTDQ